MAANTNICLAYKQFLLSYKSLMKQIWLITVRMMMEGRRRANVSCLLLDAMCSRHSRTRTSTEWQVRTGSFFF